MSVNLKASNIIPHVSQGFFYDRSTGTISTDGTLLEQIRDTMAVLIEDMTIAGGYRFDWGSSNRDDIARKDDFPNAEIYLISEDNIDDENGTHAQTYLNEATFEIHVYNKNDAIEDYPNDENNFWLNAALEDLKRLFGNNYHIDDTAHRILYKSMRTEKELAGDIFLPKKMITTWVVSYGQDRLDPDTAAC